MYFLVFFFLINDNICGVVFFFSSRRRHTRWNCDWSSDVCSSDLELPTLQLAACAQSELHRPGAIRVSVDRLCLLDRGSKYGCVGRDRRCLTISAWSDHRSGVEPPASARDRPTPPRIAAAMADADSGC